ncbi:MAG: hypothetical protein AB7I27_02390 [Bacteriovoracaceae bacterium]
MKNIFKILALVLICFPILKIKAQTPTSTTQLNSAIPHSWWKNFSMSYLSFVDGPGVFTKENSYSPNNLGKPSDDGLVMTNNVSFKYFVNSDYAIDFLTRTQWIMNNARDNEDFKSFRWNSPRLGISTTFLKTENGKLTGAFNTDLPYNLPEPIGGGYTATKRTTLLTPGFFAKYAYTPSTSRWSFLSLVQPRFYIYENRHVAEPQLTRAGYAPELKSELNLNFSPTANYAVTDRFGLRLGTQIVYQKLIISDWNPFRGTDKSADPNSKMWRLQAVPIQTGFTYVFSKLFELSTYIQGYPIGSERIDRKGNKATFENTISVGAWLSGTLF